MAKERKLTVAIGPRMPEWGSWRWIGGGLLQELPRYFDVLVFGPNDFDTIGRADVIVVVKQKILAEVFNAYPHSRVVYAPVDGIPNLHWLNANAALLKRCRRLVAHCHRLVPLLQRFTSCDYINHPLGFVSQMPSEPKKEGFIWWTGDVTYVPLVADWVNQHGVPGELFLMTNHDGRNPVDVGFHKRAMVQLEHWNPDRQLERQVQARLALDIKGPDWNQRHKPPTKVLDFIASGLPTAANPDSSPYEYVHSLGFELCSPVEIERWQSRKYWEETQRFGKFLREKLSLKQVGLEWKAVIEAACQPI